ncbi:thiamine biosynthesis protein [Microbacterium sp. CH12i]|uniref:ABC transporter substrate-binding protein n=1 Tax=Microbacterium sp. CH12i TaxID=1479651 RepID=UPI000461DA78|nr:ABC transporter substrate-binding protein [Microbacterium sp. CH12i]KDA04808.1 thiamine biosynthesis protein [Microbacterium sp. CH12i]
MKKNLRFTALAAATAAAALILSGCSGGSLEGDAKTTDAPASGDLTHVIVGVLPIAPASAMQLGIDEGIFEKHGLDVELQLGDGGAALLPAVSSGTMQFAVGNPLSVLTAASQGLDMRIIAGYSRNYENPSDPEDKAPSGIVVAADSGIKTWKDLEGKTVAINALNTQGDLGTKAMVEADGGDPSKVNFIEIAFPDQLAQLEQGNIDASWTPEPFLSKSRATEGVEFLGDPLRAIDNLYTMVTFTSGAYADANPEVVDAFRAALIETADAAMADKSKFRAAVVEHTGMDAAVVDGINLEYISGKLDPKVIEELSALALKFKFLQQEPDLSKVLMTK